MLNIDCLSHRCECTEGFKGKNCSDLAFCAYSQCPGDSQCNDLNNGYECEYSLEHEVYVC